MRGGLASHEVSKRSTNVLLPQETVDGETLTKRLQDDKKKVVRINYLSDAKPTVLVLIYTVRLAYEE